MREIRGEDELGGSIDGSMNSSAIGTELNRKITVIKKEGGARIFHVNRHSGVPLIHPTIRKHDYIETADIPPPMALFPLRKEVKSEANLPVKEKDDDESYRLSDDEVKLEEIQGEVNRLSEDEEQVKETIKKETIKGGKIKISSFKESTLTSDRDTKLQ